MRKKGDAAMMNAAILSEEAIRILTQAEQRIAAETGQSVVLVAYQSM